MSLKKKHMERAKFCEKQIIIWHNKYVSFSEEKENRPKTQALIKPRKHDSDQELTLSAARSISTHKQTE